MPRSTTLAAALAAATPLAIGAAALVSPAPAPTTGVSAAAVATSASATPAVSALATTLGTTHASTATSRVAAAAVAAPGPARSAVTSVSAGLTPAVALHPAVRLQLDVAARKRAYLEACATDQGALPNGHRTLADTIAWLECGVRATPQAPWGPTPFDRVAARVKEGCDHLAARSDAHPPDFDANDLLRLLYLYPPAPLVLATPTVTGAPASAPAASTPGSTAPAPRNRLPRAVAQQIREALLGWKYWIDEGGPDDMVYWSENHQILFHAAEYLAGQLMPDAWFPNGRMRGRDHVAKARPRILRWLDERLKFGFSEWNSPGYYEEDFKALFNLIDFCDDPLIRRRATMVVDLLVFDLARFTHRGSFGVTSGRCYEKVGGDGSRWKGDGWRQSVGELIEVLFGTRGRFNRSGAVGALCFATSSYVPPTVLLAIGQDRPTHFVDRSRVSLDFSEARDWGIGFQGLDDGMFWWGKGAYMAKQTVANTRWILRTYGVSRLRGGIEDALGFAYGAFEVASDGALYAAADLASPIVEGMCLTKANLYTYRNREVMLSSVQDYRRGQIGPQQHVWQATLGMKAVVFTTLPGKREGDGPGYWTGNAAMPSVVQHESALIAAYDAPAITRVKEGLKRTHAWLRSGEFDEVDRRRGSNLHGAWGVTRKGTWLFARKGDGYLGLYSNEGYEGGPDDWVAPGFTNVFVCQVGDAAEYGSFQAFKDRVTAARIYVRYPTILDPSPIYVGYDIPNRGRLELHYGGTPRLNGQPYPVNEFPRYDNPYTYVPWGQPSMAIRHAGFELVHLRDVVNPQDPRGDLRIAR
ncbi:MAG: hypothetical protein M9894_32385 [Planctomycetes bacterium]|nr:hypothetical protein [Planctomycetota bacterium]